MDALIFKKAVKAYSTSRPEEIPFLEYIRRTMDFEAAQKPQGDNLLMHNLPCKKQIVELVSKIHRKYDY